MFHYMGRWIIKCPLIQYKKRSRIVSGTSSRPGMYIPCHPMAYLWKKSISRKKSITIWIDRMGEKGRSLHFYNCTADRSMLVDNSVKESTVQSRIYHREMQCKSLQMQYRTRDSLRNKLVLIYIGMYFIKVIQCSGRQTREL